ncbi:hypothetical protein ABPG75_008789 [Micractinium tetrahymenae]
MAATAEDEAIIRKRYLTQTVLGTANALPPFKKLVKKYLQFCAALQGGGTEEAERLHPELLADLYAIQAHMDRLRAMSDAYAREQAAYAEKQAQLQASIAQAERDIEERKRELAEARVELAHKQEYEAVKKQIMQVPARSATLAEQEGARREIADLQQQSAALDVLFDTRKQQFAGILASLEQLQRYIDRDEPEESVVALPEGAAGGGGEGVGVGAQPSQQQQQQAMQVG